MHFGGRAYKMEDIRQIGSMGLSFAEINFLEGGELIHAPRDLMREARRWNLTYLVHAPNEGNPYEIERLGTAFFQEIVRLIHICGEICASLLTVHFWLDGRFIPQAVLHRKREILCRMAREGARAGVQVCLENLSERPEDLHPLLARCPELGITLDIGHGQILSRRNRAPDFVGRWPERILHVHAHDNFGGDRVADDLHLSIGEGIIDFPHIFRVLVDAGYREVVTLEVPPDHLAESLRRAQQIVAPLIQTHDQRRGLTHEP